MKVADMLADNPGTWMLHCHVSDHMMSGMFALYTIHKGGFAHKEPEPDNAILP